MKFEFEPNELAQIIKEDRESSTEAETQDLVELVLLKIAVKIGLFLDSHASDGSCTFDRPSFLAICGLHISRSCVG